MKQNESSLTSLVSAFSRAYHIKHDAPVIFNDTFAQNFLTDGEYEAISQNMASGIAFFSPEKATELSGDEALKWVNQIQLSPTPLARAAFSEQVVLNEINLGAEQYVILGAGLDTFAWRYPDVNLHIFEVDHPASQQFKRERLAEASIQLPTNLTFVPMDFAKELSLASLITQGFDPTKKTVFSLLGVTYYLTKEIFEQLLHTLFKDLPKGSSIIFDIADERLFTETGIFSRVQNMVQMAAASGEPMQFCSSIAQLEQFLEQQDMHIFEHLSPQGIQDRYFADREDDLQAFETIHYVHAVKK